MGVFAQVLKEPIVGVANNGDFQRYSLKIGLDYKENPREEGKGAKYFWNYIIEDFKFVQPQDTGFSSTHELTGKIAIFLNNISPNDGDFNIKWMGVTNAVLYLFGIGLLFFGLRCERMGTVIFFSLAGILFLTDREIVQYFNSFYTEPGSIIYLIFFLGLALLYPSIIKSSKKCKGIILLVIEAFVIFMFLGAKLQNILGIIPMSGVFGMQIFSLLKSWIKKTKVKIVISFLLTILFVVIPSISVFTKNMEGSSNLVSYNIIMMELLDLSEKPKEHLSKMGLSSDDIDLLSKDIGTNVYTSGDSYLKYSQYFNRSAQLNILLKEPRIALELISKQSTYLFKPLTYGNFLEVAGKGAGAVSTRFTYVESIKKLLYPKNVWFFASVLLLAFVISILKIKKNKQEESVWKSIIFLSLPIFTILFFLTTVFGDSGHEIIKHLFLVNVLFDAVLIITIFHLLTLFIELLRKFLDRKKSKNFLVL